MHPRTNCALTRRTGCREARGGVARIARRSLACGPAITHYLRKNRRSFAAQPRASRPSFALNRHSCTRQRGHESVSRSTRSEASRVIGRGLDGVEWSRSAASAIPTKSVAAIPISDIGNQACEELWHRGRIVTLRRLPTSRTDSPPPELVSVERCSGPETLATTQIGRSKRVKTERTSLRPKWKGRSISASTMTAGR